MSKRGVRLEARKDYIRLNSQYLHMNSLTFIQQVLTILLNLTTCILLRNLKIITI